MAVSDVIVLLKYGPLTDQLANNANCLPIGRSQRERAERVDGARIMRGSLV